jgi:hypothetical protein
VRLLTQDKEEGKETFFMSKFLLATLAVFIFIILIGSSCILTTPHPADFVVPVRVIAIQEVTPPENGNVIIVTSAKLNIFRHFSFETNKNIYKVGDTVQIIQNSALTGQVVK